MSEALRTARYSDLLALGDEVKGEIIAGAVEIQASPRWIHGATHTAISQWVGLVAQDDGSGGPGGWWIVADVSIAFSGEQVLRPDLAGWRREHMPHPPEQAPVELRPDWVCEILSPSDRRRDLVTKRKIYQEAGVPWYWQVDPDDGTVTVLELTERGYLIRTSVDASDECELPPFDGHRFVVKRFFPQR